MKSLNFTLTIGDAEVDVTATPEDAPDRSVGLLGWTFDITAMLNGEPFTLDERQEELAAEIAEGIMLSGAEQ